MTKRFFIFILLLLSTLTTWADEVEKNPNNNNNQAIELVKSVDGGEYALVSGNAEAATSPILIFILSFIVAIAVAVVVASIVVKRLGNDRKKVAISNGSLKAIDDMINVAIKSNLRGREEVIAVMSDRDKRDICMVIEESINNINVVNEVESDSINEVDDRFREDVLTEHRLYLEQLVSSVNTLSKGVKGDIFINLFGAMLDSSSKKSLVGFVAECNKLYDDTTITIADVNCGVRALLVSTLGSPSSWINSINRLYQYSLLDFVYLKFTEEDNLNVKELQNLYSNLLRLLGAYGIKVVNPRLYIDKYDKELFADDRNNIMINNFYSKYTKPRGEVVADNVVIDISTVCYMVNESGAEKIVKGKIVVK